MVRRLGLLLGLAKGFLELRIMAVFVDWLASSNHPKQMHVSAIRMRNLLAARAYASCGKTS